MGFKLEGSVWKSSLPPRLKPLASRLASYADDNTGRKAYPSVGRLAWELGVSDRAVQMNLRKLELLSVIRKIGVWHTRTNEYQVVVERLPTRPAWLPDRAKPASPSLPTADISGQHVRVNSTSPYVDGGSERVDVRVNSSASLGEPSHPSEVNQGSPDPLEIDQGVTEPPLAQRDGLQEVDDGEEPIPNVSQADRHREGRSTCESHRGGGGPNRDHQDRGEPGSTCLHDGERVEGDERGSERLRVESGVRSSTNGTNHDRAGSGQKRAGMEGLVSTGSVAYGVIKELQKSNPRLAAQWRRQLERRRVTESSRSRDDGAEDQGL